MSLGNETNSSDAIQLSLNRLRAGQDDASRNSSAISCRRRAISTGGSCMASSADSPSAFPLSHSNGNVTRVLIVIPDRSRVGLDYPNVLVVSRESPGSVVKTRSASRSACKIRN